MSHRIVQPQAFTADDAVVEAFADETGAWVHVVLIRSDDDGNETAVTSLLLSDVEAKDLGERISDARWEARRLYRQLG